MAPGKVMKTKAEKDTFVHRILPRIIAVLPDRLLVSSTPEGTWGPPVVILHGCLW